MSTPTSPADVVTAAMSIAKDAAEGRLSPTGLEATAVTECRELFGTVAGVGDPLWDLHRDIARQVLALDGVPADELSEWLAVTRQRTSVPVSEPDADQAPPEPESLPSGPLSPESAEPDTDGHADALAEADDQPDADAQPEPQPRPQRRTDGYDPLAGWSPGGSRRSV